MIKSFSHNLSIMAIFTIGLSLAMVPRLAIAQNTAVPIEGWHKECNKQADNDICIVQNVITAPSGQLVTAVGLVEVSGKLNQKILQVTVPTTRFIEPGISIQVDGGKQVKVPYAICLPDKCIAQAPLTDEVITSFKKGGEVVFTSVNAQRAANPIRISLSGFTQVYDGEAIGRTERERKAKLREEEIRKKLEESRIKLQAAQDAAKKSQ